MTRKIKELERCLPSVKCSMPKHEDPSFDPQNLQHPHDRPAWCCFSTGDTILLGGLLDNQSIWIFRYWICQLTTIYNSSFQGIWYHPLFWPPQALGTHVMHRHTCKWNTHIHKKYTFKTRWTDHGSKKPKGCLSSRPAWTAFMNSRPARSI